MPVLVLGTLFLLAGLGRASERYTKEDMPRFLTDLQSQDAKVRIQACQGIGDVGEIKACQARAALDPLLELLAEDDDPKVRVAAAIALGRIEANPVWTIPALIETINTDPDRSVVTAAVTSLGIYGKEAKEALPLLKEL
jgi:HEAT repeat protein